MATRITKQTTCMVALLLGSPTLGAQHTPPAAYQWAAQSAGVPVFVLYAVALQESGWTWQRRFVPWPWTLNVAGEPHRFHTRAQACSTLTRALTQVPATRIDAGLAQLNVGFQGHRVAHPCQLLDPYRNLQIAATVIREHHTTDDADWLIAAGRYHRPAGGPPASEYRRRVKQHLTRLSDAGSAP